LLLCCLQLRRYSGGRFLCIALFESSAGTAVVACTALLESSAGVAAAAVRAVSTVTETHVVKAVDCEGRGFVFAAAAAIAALVVTVSAAEFVVIAVLKAVLVAVVGSVVKAVAVVVRSAVRAVVVVRNVVRVVVVVRNVVRVVVVSCVVKAAASRSWVSTDSALSCEVILKGATGGALIAFASVAEVAAVVVAAAARICCWETQTLSRVANSTAAAEIVATVAFASG